jgi:hypothetical protein
MLVKQRSGRRPHLVSGGARRRTAIGCPLQQPRGGDHGGLDAGAAAGSDGLDAGDGVDGAGLTVGGVVGVGDELGRGE